MALQQPFETVFKAASSLLPGNLCVTIEMAHFCQLVLPDSIPANFPKYQFKNQQSQNENVMGMFDKMSRHPEIKKSVHTLQN